MTPAPLYTIGYEGRAPDELLQELQAAKVERLVDVRELPLSHKRGFSKKPLSEQLHKAGIAYVHAKALGLPKEQRDRWRSGDMEGAAKVYRRYLRHEGRQALQELADSLGDRPACLLCFERDHAVCHRELIVQRLEQLRPDLRVEHL
jgi:uncharacterized protein (DUF488 family)